MGEVLFTISLLVGLVGVFAIMGLTGGGWAWIKTMGVIALVIVIAEIWSKVKDGKTISQKFWRWSMKTVDGKRVNIVKAWIVLGVLQLGWLSLLIHLAWKMLTGAEYPVPVGA